MADAGRSLGLDMHVLELGPLWQQFQTGKTADVVSFAAWLREHNVRAVLGYTCNGLTEFPCVSEKPGRVVSVFERLNIPHLMWWTDHPQWAGERVGLREDLQPLLSSPNQYHFMKSDAAAKEVSDMLHWPNCVGLPVAENPERYAPTERSTPEYDLVCITGAPPAWDEELARRLDGNDPELQDILGMVEKKTAARLTTILQKHGPADLSMEMDALGRAWCAARRREPLATAHQLFVALEGEHRNATAWIRGHYAVYFDALECLWEFGRWQRTFYIRYLAKFFRMGVFGSDWSSVGLGPGGWVDYDRQASVYRRGRIALNIPQAGDEQGVAHKPFQIAAARVPMAHLYRRGLEDCFEPNNEVLTFESPREARDRIAALLDDPVRGETMATAAYDRLLREHTWKTRLPRMLSVLGDRSPLSRTSTTHASTGGKPPAAFAVTHEG